jgi:hypothetical protein
VFSGDKQALVQAQTTIGWHHLLYGCLASDWSTIQTCHVKNSNLNPQKYSGAKWASGLIKYLWQSLHQLWETHNKSLHGTTFEESQPAQRERLSNQITMLYARRAELHLHDQAMFRRPLAERLQQPLSVLTIWLSVALPAFQAACSDNSDLSEHTHEDDPPSDTDN